MRGSVAALPTNGKAEKTGNEIREDKAPRGASVDWLPWVPFEDNVLILPEQDGIFETDSGILGVRKHFSGGGGGETCRKGMVVAIGPGKFYSGIGFVSPRADLLLRLKDIVLFDAATAMDVNIDGAAYVLVRPDDIRVRLKDEAGLRTRRKFIQDLVAQIEKHKALGDESGNDTVTETVPGTPKSTYKAERDEMAERAREARGTATKTQILVPGGVTE